MTHSARETADRTKEALAPYASQARDTAAHLAHEARHRIGPAVEALGPKLEQAFASLPPQTQANTLKAVHRAQEAAVAAKLSAARAQGHVSPRISAAQAALAPVAQQAQQRGSAALTALQGHVSAAEIGELAARNAKKEHRHAPRGTALAVTGALAIAAGVCAWQWWRRQSSPEWLVEPPASIGTAPATPVNGSTALTQEAPVEEPPAEDDHPKPHPPKTGDDRPKPHDPRKPH